MKADGVSHADRFHWRGQDLLRLPIEERKAIISKDVAMIFSRGLLLVWIQQRQLASN